MTRKTVGGAEEAQELIKMLPEMSVEEISQDPTTSLASMNKKAVVEKPKELCKGCEKPSANNRAFATEKTNDKCYERGRGDVSETKAIINSSIQADASCNGVKLSATLQITKPNGQKSNVQLCCEMPDYKIQRVTVNGEEFRRVN